MINTVSYEYQNLPIPGGGYVTGFLYHPKKEGLLYLRTDIGGSYRYDTTKKVWKSLISHVTMEDLSETYPISIAVDEAHPERFYVACGINSPNSGILVVSEAYGERVTYEKIPVLIHGNLGGRGTGERLIVDRMDSNRLYFASQQDGLWKSNDRGHTWERLYAMKETHLTFVKQILLESATVLIVGSAGVNGQTKIKKQTQPEQMQAMRGPALYMSRDGGQSFEPMEQPESVVIEGCRFQGLAAQRCSEDAKYFYVTFASTGRRSYLLEDGYSCDSGDSIDGHLVRYRKETDGFGCMEEITPVAASKVMTVSDVSKETSNESFIDCQMPIERMQMYFMDLVSIHVSILVRMQDIIFMNAQKQLIGYQMLILVGLIVRIRRRFRQRAESAVYCIWQLEKVVCGRCS